MKFRTKVSPPPLNFHIDYHHRLFFIGSCFTEQIGKKFSELRFKAIVNPYGIIYNPASIAKNILTAIHNDDIRKAHIVEDERGVFHYDFHSSIHASNPDDILEKIQTVHGLSREALHSNDVIFITLGTAFVYRLKRTGQIVANCHKQPSSLFTKELLTVPELSEILHALVENLIRLNTHTKIVFTVSPVRHLSEGLIDNQLSKSILICAIHETVQKYEQAHYFPAYEIVMDDLRDYRFYKADLIHPNDSATTYIWDYMSSQLFTDETQNTMLTIKEMVQSLAHKPLFPGSLAHVKFLEATLNKMKTFAVQHGHIPLHHEIEEIEAELSKIKSAS
jgi:hypothetical protein